MQRNAVTMEGSKGWQAAEKAGQGSIMLACQGPAPQPRGADTEQNGPHPLRGRFIWARMRTQLAKKKKKQKGLSRLSARFKEGDAIFFVCLNRKIDFLWNLVWQAVLGDWTESCRVASNPHGDFEKPGLPWSSASGATLNPFKSHLIKNAN